MNNFELIEHTADIGIVASGSTMMEAFASAAAGLFSIISNLSRVTEKESRELEVVGTDMEGLLFNWINELIYTFEMEHMLFCRFDVTEMAESYLKATCYGEKYNPETHMLKIEVKSSTYYQLNVDRVNNRIQVILDV